MSSTMPTFSLLHGGGGRDGHSAAQRGASVAFLTEKYRNPVAACIAFSLLVLLLWGGLSRMAGSSPGMAPTMMLEEGKVIPDVLDLFKAEAELTVTYGQRMLLDGQQLNRDLADKTPALRIHNLGVPNPSGRYVVVMVDPDAPSPARPTAREWLHWIVTDVPADMEITEARGTHVMAYAPPTPPEGKHRYVFAVFNQPVGMPPLEAPEKRANFNLRYFATEHSLGQPVAALYFEFSAPKRR